MINGSPEYKTAMAFRRAVNDRLKTRAREMGVPLAQLQRRFVFERFLAVLFDRDDAPWMLKGGAGLQMRLPAARASNDLDLAHLDADVEVAVARLREALRPATTDWLVFELGTPQSGTGAIGLPVQVSIGAPYTEFRIDVAKTIDAVIIPEPHDPIPLIDVPGLPPARRIQVYPWPDQIADKVCAMYERHQGRPSSRFRDLVDLCAIVAAAQFDAAPLRRALEREQNRRSLTLPTEIRLPDPSWNRSWRPTVTKAGLESVPTDIEDALRQVGSCLNPVLSGVIAEGRWVPTIGWSR